MKEKRIQIRRSQDTAILLLSKELASFKKEVTDRLDAQDKKMQPVADAFTGMNWTRTALIWILSVVGSVTAIIIGIKTILKK